MRMPGWTGGVWLTVVTVNTFLGVVTNTNKFDFGLTENSALLRDLHTEDLLLTARLEEAKERLNSEVVDWFTRIGQIIPDTVL